MQKNLLLSPLHTLWMAVDVMLAAPKRLQEAPVVGLLVVGITAFCDAAKTNVVYPTNKLVLWGNL